MSELLEERKTPQPEWLDLPEEEKLEHTYWTIFGDNIKGSSLDLNPSIYYTHIYHSKEEAEACASMPSDVWIWNKEPAQPTTLQAVMNRARKRGNAGVIVLGYRNREWKELKRYPCSVPLNSYKEE